MKGDIGVIGLAVMGQNLILNMNDHGFKVVAHNRTAAKVDEFLEGPAKGTNIIGAYSLEELVEKLETPRKVMLMVRAGDVVDKFIDALVPLLDKGDIIIDGGNTNYPDTNRRVAALREKGIHFIGTGVSGGEEGARFGPSIMPGGAQKLGKRLSLSSKVFLRKLTLASLVVIGLVTMVQVTSLRWFTTASNTATCS